MTTATEKAGRKNRLFIKGCTSAADPRCVRCVNIINGV